MDDSLIFGAVVVNTGNGDDDVVLDAWNVAGYEDPDIFHSRVSLIMGGGDDSLSVGKAGADGAYAVFSGPLFASGGAGTDIMSALSNGNIFASSTSHVGFEAVS